MEELASEELQTLLTPAVARWRWMAMTLTSVILTAGAVSGIVAISQYSLLEYDELGVRRVSGRPRLDVPARNDVVEVALEDEPRAIGQIRTDLDTLDELEERFA